MSPLLSTWLCHYLTTRAGRLAAHKGPTAEIPFNYRDSERRAVASNRGGGRRHVASSRIGRVGSMYVVLRTYARPRTRGKLHRQATLLVAVPAGAGEQRPCLRSHIDRADLVRTADIAAAENPGRGRRRLARWTEHGLGCRGGPASHPAHSKPPRGGTRVYCLFTPRLSAPLVVCLT